MSSDAKEAIGRSLIDETPEGRLTMGDGAGDLDVWAMKMAQGVGSMVPTLLAGGVTGAAAKASIGRAVTTSMLKRGATQEVAEAVAAKTVAKLATGAAVTTGATGSVGSAGVNTRESVLGMSFDELSRSDTFRQAFTRIDQDQQTQHLSDEEKLALAREETANVASRATMSDAKVWGAAAMGSVMGDAMLFKMLAGKAATGGVLKGAAKGAVGEGIGETLEEGVQQYTINESLNEVAAADIDPMKGVVSSALEGGLIGMGTGGALGGAGGLRGSKSQPESEGGAQVDLATVEDVAPVEQGEPMQENPAAAPADPDLEPAADAMADPVVAPSGEQSPLGPSASQFPGVFERDQRGILRVKGDVDALASWAEQANMPYITDGDGIAIPAKYAKQAEKAIKRYKAADAKPLAEPALADDMPEFSKVDPIEEVPAYQRQGDTVDRATEPQAVTGTLDLGSEIGGMFAGEHNPLGSDKFDPVREVPAFQRQGFVRGSHDFKGTPIVPLEGELLTPGSELMPLSSSVEVGAPRTTATASGPGAGELLGGGAALPDLRQPPPPQQIEQSDTIFAGGEPGADPRNSAYTPPRLSRDQVDRTLGEESTRDPRSPVSQSIARAGSETDSVFGSLQTLRITRKGKPFATEKEATMASRKGKEMPVPLNGGGFGVAEIAEVEQVKAANNSNAINGPQGNNQPQAEVSNEPVTPVPAISSEGQGDQPGAGDQAAAGAGPAIAGLANRAGSGNPADNTPTSPVPDGQQQDDQTLTAPATDAGAAVSGRIGEDELRDRDLLKEHNGRWKYRSAVGAGWFTANTREAAIERAEEAYRNGLAKGIPAPTRAERWAKEEQEFAERMDGRFGKMTIPELEERHRKLGGAIADLQQAGRNEMNGNGGRRTGAAVASEGARQSGQEKMELERYIQLRRDRDTTGSGVNSQQIEAARAEVAPEPTDAQKEAGNYKKGHLKLQGLDIALENPKGSTRSGTDKDGKAWQSTMAHDYGYIKRTLGADGDHVDVFIGDRPDSETVYVVDQVDPKTGKFDEHKVMMGFADEQAAQTGYLANYEKGWKGLGSIKAMPVEEFKRWVKDGDTTKPVGEQPAAGVDIGTLTDDEVLAVADELGISHDDNPDDARWGLEGAKKDALSTAIARVRNPSSTTPTKPAASNSNIVSAPPLQDEGGGAKRAVSFSKQAMAQGEKPAKHLTRKEAELVTKEWFKQYRGASGINVQIHATQAELEKALGLAAKDGLIRRAAFDDDNGTLHVAADTIANPKRMREILRHEVLAHYGLANVLGDGEYTKLISRIIKSKNAPSMKAVWDWVDTHYAGEDVGVQAEEVIAHLAELEQSAWRRGWDQVVAWVTKALRTVGFVPGGITAAETRVLIEGLGKKMKRGYHADSKGSDVARFSQGRVMSQEYGNEPAGSSSAHQQDTNSDGNSIAFSGDGLHSFWRWFGNSKAVDDSGRPLVLYHGTKAEFTEFKRKYGGIYFSPERSFSEDVFTHEYSGGVIEAYLSMKRPFDARWKRMSEADKQELRDIIDLVVDEDDVNDIREKTGRYDWDAFESITDGELWVDAGRGMQDKILSAIRDAGYDGVIMHDSPSAGVAGTSYVVFEPDQIRNTGDFSDSKDSDSRNVRFSQTNTAADAAMDKLNLGAKPDIIDKTKANLDKLRKVDRGVVESWVGRFIKKANTEVLDALAPIKYAEDAAGITDAADSGYVAARMATGAASTMQATMLYGLPEWKDGVIQRKAGTGEKDALLGIFSDLGADLHNWLGWMAGHRAELLMAQGRENLLDANDIAALKGQGKGKEAKFLDAKARWNRLNAATLDLAQEAGLFTKEARAEFENEWYIPFFRESEDGDVIAPFKPKGIANQNAGIKKLKGGEANTNDLLENIFTSTSKLIDASMKNMAAQKTVWNLADTGLIEVIPKPNKMDYQALANGKDRIMLKLEGDEYMLRVEDPDLYRAMTFFDRKPFGKMTMMASSAKRILTAGVTASPEFMLRNFLRDSLSSWAISKDGFKPVIDSIKGVKKTLAMDGSTIDVMFSGASFLGGYVNGNDPGAMADTVRKSLRRKGMTPEQIARYEKSIIRNAAHAKGVVADAWEKYSRYGEALENANREAVYAAAIKAGKSHAQAAFESKDLMDFSMLGAARAIQGASLVLPFFNARLQGLGKLSRELRDNPREIAKRAGMITAMSLGLLAANWDDERYEELPDWDKDANWHFFVGDQHFRIPKPFEIGVMFGTIPERMVRAMGDKDTGAQFGKAVARAIGDTFALNPTPQIIKPLVEAAFNYDTFRGGPIDSPQDLAVKAEARYNEQTSLLMRELGELSGFSPKQLEHLVIGYTGTIGGYVMATADGLIRASRPGESASWRADEIPLVKAVYRGTGPAKSTQHMEEFYRMLSEVNQLKRTVDQYRSEGLDDKANELLEEQGGILKSRRSLSRTQQQVRVVRNKIELIQRDRTMNAEEKRKRIDELLARRNDLVYQAVNKNRENWE
ncbi:TPA: LPD38 domain-containing protein [Aeromonas veronii]